MLKDNKPIINKPNPSIKKGSIIKKLLNFLDDTLLIFQKENIGEINTAEEILNEQLGKTLNYYSKPLPFFFQQETIQKQNKGQNRKVDIGVFCHYSDSQAFFTIEAKRLTTAFSDNRKKEYVSGNNNNKLTGGIERFKHNLHGINLKHSAIVGYVQRENNKYWFKEINKWIMELYDNFWNANDLLINICGFENDKIAKFKSINKKLDNTNITLNHYFVNLTN
jgi:hypothetical protein